jgi:hypothetical protein
MNQMEKSAGILRKTTGQFRRDLLAPNRSIYVGFAPRKPVKLRGTGHVTRKDSPDQRSGLIDYSIGCYLENL